MRRRPRVVDARKDLELRRDELYDRLVTLERMRVAARVDDGRYAIERRSLIAKLVVVHRELDALDGPPPKRDSSARAS